MSCESRGGAPLQTNTTAASITHDGEHAMARAMNAAILRSGGLQAAVINGELRCLAFSGVEILRGLNAPLRDENWGVVETEVVVEDTTSHSYTRRCKGKDAAVEGSCTVEMVGERELQAHFSLRALERTSLNRAGLTLLHPIKGVAGSCLNLRQPGGGSSQMRFPLHVAPAQP